MSDEIPFHVQEEIMKRLPVKSLVQFRCVSKAWRSLIDSSEFITAHSLRQHSHHLLVSYENPVIDEDYVLFSRSYMDDDGFPKQMAVPTLPQSVKQLILPIVVGSSRGLLCLLESHPNVPIRMAVVWNPSIRKSVSVLVPGEPSVDFGFSHFGGARISPSVGFGVCPVTGDPKIVAITNTCGFMVYTLSSGEWRTLSNNLPDKRPSGLYCTVVTDRFIYWNVVKVEGLTMILSFDLTSEAFDVIHLPDSLALAPLNHSVARISKLRESLALLQYGADYNLSTVWVMEHDGARISFSKLYTLTTPHSYIVGFRKNGMPIVQYDDDDDDIMAKLVVYDPNSEHDNVIEIRNQPYHFDVHSYMETLLLLGRSDYTSY